MVTPESNVPDSSKPVVPDQNSDTGILADKVVKGRPLAPSDWKRKRMLKVRLSFSAANLANRDIITKSDPMAVVFAHDAATKQWFEAGRTEALKDNLNPDWQKEYMHLDSSWLEVDLHN